MNYVDDVLLKATDSQNNRNNNGVEVIFDALVLSTIHNISSMFQYSGSFNYQEAIGLKKGRRADSSVIADNFWIPDDCQRYLFYVGVTLLLGQGTSNYIVKQPLELGSLCS